MRVAILGCGFVGSAVAERLVRTGHHVTGTTTSADRVPTLRAIGVDPRVLDVGDVDAIHDVLRDRDAVLLCVAPRNREDDYRSTYLVAAKNLIDAAYDTKVAQIIYTGSTRVYGQDDGGWVDEDSPTDPADDNGRILVDTERTLLGDVLHGSPRQHPTATVLRLGGIYGGGRDYLGFVHAQAGTRRHDGDMYINRIHVEDIVVAAELLLTRPYHGPLNLCDDHPQTKKSFYDAVLAAAELPPIEWVAGKETTGLGKRVRNTRIKKTLDMTLRHPRRVV